jgi:ribosomal protein S18 acetylase RimI-like enzyme
VKVRPFRRDDLTAAAHVVHRSHQGTLDAALNLTYASPAHCRGFVETLVLRAGCGRFDPDASFVAETRDGAAGVLLASHLSRSNGHICQVSVLPEAQGRGLGEVLMASALASFRRQDGLYERLGFRLRKQFAAHAWVRPPARIELPA